uniref:FCH and mu domain containing endocytic adaptor 1 n=1 Tax=Gadus morhua TaxID=8049 RepID=A0A8C5FXP2_GADMO
LVKGEKNTGFDVLYHNMKHGQLATKELAEFVRERAAVEETYSKSMCKLSKMASSGSPQGTFAPLWDVFRVSSDKLALCHLELMRKMNDLIRDVNKYGEEQGKTHRKTKEEVVGTLEAVQGLQGHSAQLQKAREAYHSRCGELERLRKEAAPQKEVEKAELKSKKAAEALAVSIEKYNRVGAEFQQKMSDSAQKFQDIEEAHLRQMKLLIKGYSHSIEDTHVQVGQVHEEFKQNVENIGTDNLLQKFAEQKGTGKERPAVVGFEEYMPALVVEGGKKSRGKAFRIPGLDSKDRHFYSSDSDFDDEEPKKFHIQIRPVASGRHCTAAAEKELKATVGALTLPPNRAVCTLPLPSSSSRTSSNHRGRERRRDRSMPPPTTSDDPFAITMIGSPTHQSSLTSPAPPPAPPPSGRLAASVSAGCLSVAPPRKELLSWNSVHNPFSDGPPPTPPPQEEGGRGEGGRGRGAERRKQRSSDGEPRLHLSRGPSPISLSPQDAWPVAAAITEYINAYFKGGQHNRCLVKITGDLTMSFPAGFTRIFTANPNTPVLSFRLVNISRVDHFLPNQKLLYSDPSQSDPDSRDMWFNMWALEQHLKREAELNPGASYYNVGLLKYQVSSQDPGRAPLLLSAECQRSGTVTRVSLDYHCCPATAPSTQLNAVQVLLGLEPGDTDLQCQPPATCSLVVLLEGSALHFVICACACAGSGTLCASWQCLEVPRRPPPHLAVQFVGSGASLSGMDVELVGSRYRMSLVKKRFATGKYMAGCSL